MFKARSLWESVESVGFRGGSKTGEPGEKPLGGKDENQQQTKPTYEAESLLPSC